MEEYDRFDGIFSDTSRDPKRLLELLDALKGADKKLKLMSKEGFRLKEIFELLWLESYAFEDDEYAVCAYV